MSAIEEKSLVQNEDEVNELVESGDEDDSGLEQEEGSDDEERVPVDLSQNEFYRGICTLLEDEDGNNILEYISLLHTELIGINKSLENLRSMKKDIGRIADCAEVFMKSKKLDSSNSSEPKKDEKRRKDK
jgi:capsule polysaccharide export protein KpsE/RkpR